jgi:hypothetical protein
MKVATAIAATRKGCWDIVEWRGNIGAPVRRG